ncbi:tail fiber domain-containing protein, partial [bacterium]|nr:tail fiber domain-containing protein [bacterium]
SSTDTGSLFLTGSTANKQAVLKCTNGNLHIDSNSGSNTYLNYYTGNGIAFGNGASGIVAWMGSDGDLWKGSGDNTGSKYWHAGNDGSSSGLDADLLDGYHLSTTRNAANTVPVRDASGYLQLGWINTTSGSTTNTITKIYGTYSGDNYIRYFTPATLISQQGIWTSANDGTGSGLDADLLDGNHASAFAVASHTHNMLIAVDDRDMKPNTSGVGSGVKGIKAFFSSYGGMTGTADTDYQDVLVLDTYADTSGGNANAITLDKSSSAMRIWNAAQGATSWGTPQRVFADNYHPNADKLTTARNINGVAFDGTANITVADATKLPLSGGTLTGDLTIPSKIIHAGDTDTYFQFHGANLARMVIAGAEVQEWGANYTLFSDNDTVRLGTSSDFRMYFNGTDTIFRNYAHNNGDVYFQGEGSDGVNETAIKLDFSGTRSYVILYENSAERFRTNSTGIGVTGNISVTGTVDGRDVSTDGTKLDGIESGATADQTASEILTAIKTVDGSGSGLDADTVDGIQASSFLRSDTNDTHAGTLSLDIVQVGNELRLPSNTSLTDVTLTGVGDEDTGFNWSGSNAVNYVSGGVLKYNLNNVWHSGNDGSGSGLDADTVDGVHESTFMRKSANSNLDMNNNNITDVEDIYLQDRIYHDGDTTTYIQFNLLNTWRVVTGGSTRLTVNNSAVAASVELRSTGNVIAYYSDERLKTKVGVIENAVEKVKSLDAFYYVENDLAKSFGYNNDKKQVALSAQGVQKVLPEAVTLAPFDMEDNPETGETFSKSGENYLTVDYAKMVPLLVQAIKELKAEIEELRGQ